MLSVSLNPKRITISDRGPGGDSGLLNEYLIGKLLWDPSLNGQELIDGWLTAYYGPAAPSLSAYM